MKRLSASFLMMLPLLAGSCAMLRPHPAPSPYMHLGDEEQIYSIVFDSLAGPDVRGWAVSTDLIECGHCPRDSTWQRCCEHVTDSIRALPDSLLARVYIVDTTMSRRLWFCPPAEEWQISATEFLLRDVDDAYGALLCIADSLARGSTPFHAQWLHSRYGYRPVSFHGYFRGVHETETYITRLFTFSRIGFDAARTKACVVTDLRCGSLCASEDFWFLEKIGAQWVLVNRIIGSQS